MSPPTTVPSERGVSELDFLSEPATQTDTFVEPGKHVVPPNII